MVRECLIALRTVAATSNDNVPSPCHLPLPSLCCTVGLGDGNKEAGGGVDYDRGRKRDMRLVIYVEGGLVQEVLYDRPEEKDGYGAPFEVIIEDEDNEMVGTSRYGVPLLGEQPAAVERAYQEFARQESAHQ